VYCNTNDQAADLFTKGYLSGTDVAKRFETLDRRVRGETRSPKWIDDLVTGMKPKPTNAGKLVPALEIQPPMMNLKTYLDLADPPRTYQSPPQRDAALMTQVRALAAKLGAREANGKFILPKVINILELFCGENHSAVNALLALCANPEYLNVVRDGLVETLDVDPKCAPTILADITRWDPIKHGSKTGQFQFIWCSIPCTQYSVAKTTGKPRDLKTADRIGRAAIRTIFKLRPEIFALENPRGLLRDRPYMRPLRRFLRSVSYCMFQGYIYRKETDIYTNVDVPFRNCRTTPCNIKRRTGRHPETAQRGPSANGAPGNSLEQLHSVPHELIQMLLIYGFFPDKLKVQKYLPEDLKDSKEAKALRATLKWLERAS
jgi:hypothetical protein